MHINWNQLSQSEWDLACAKTDTGLQQDWAYGASLQAMGLQSHRAQVILQGQTVALAQFVCRRYAGIIGLALCTRGPLWLTDLSPSEKKNIFRELKRSLPVRRSRWLVFSSPLINQHDPGLSSLTRVMTGYSTVLIDLTRSSEQLRAASEGRWRNRLIAAEREDISIVRAEKFPEQMQWLLEAEQMQRKEKNFYGLPVKFIQHYSEARLDQTKTILMLQAEIPAVSNTTQEPTRIAAMLFLIHGCSATYHLGWINALGRAKHAHNLLMWHAFEELRARGIRTLDLGGINTRSLAGISRFKIGTGGSIVTYAGTYL